MANLSPPPSPPLNPHQLAASNVIRRASAFNSVLGQKLNVADSLFYNPLLYPGAILWNPFLLNMSQNLSSEPKETEAPQDVLTPEREEPSCE
jgi:hypothetical protein